MIRTCKVKLGRAYKQEARLFTLLYFCRQLYNAALQQRIEAYNKQGISLSYFDQCKGLTQLRATDGEYYFLPVMMLRLTSLKRLDEAFKGFFRRIKKDEKPGFPRFRGRDRFDTLIFDKQSWKIEGKKLIIKARLESPIVLHMRNKIHREGEILGLRLTKQAGRWWAHFLVDVGEAPKVQPSKNGVGIDVGIRTFATLSDGEQIKHPRFLQKSQEQLRKAHQEVSCKKKGSKNRSKAKFKLSRVYEKISNRRQNFLHQTIASLVAAGYDGFAVEDLDIREMVDSKKVPEGMTKKGAQGLRRGIMDAAWSKFLTYLGNKAEEAGFSIVRVDPRGTSQQCSNCGSIVRKTLRDRIHNCHACGLVLDRDENAARNILQRAKNNPGCGLVAGDILSKNIERAEVSS